MQHRQGLFQTYNITRLDTCKKKTLLHNPGARCCTCLLHATAAALSHSQLVKPA